MLVPKLFTTLKTYNKKQFYKDVIAGIIVGIIALPLAIAFGIASGVSPEKGLITAVIGGFLISVLGGSRVQIGGPTGAFIVIVYGIVHNYGLDGLMIATIMAGVILIIMGFMKLGNLIKFIPIPLIAGFTSGIALIIFTTELKDLFGLKIENLPAEFLEKIPVYIQNFNTINTDTAIISLITLLIIIFLPYVTRKIPAIFLALVVGTLVTHFFGFNVETISSRFGEISNSIPSPSFPVFSYTKVYALLGPAFTIAILAAIESLLSAVITDGMTGGRHRSNMELIANGAANIASPIFGGIPVTGAIARTVTNIKSGGSTPVAGIIHSLILFLVIIFFGKYAGMVPLSVLAAILVAVAYNMFDWREFRSQLKMPKSDVIVFLSTFFLTILFDLTIAIEIGMILSAFLFMNRMAKVANIGIITRELNDDSDTEDAEINSIQNKNIPDGVVIYEVNGPFFFGAAGKFNDVLRTIHSKSKILILRLRNVPAIDATGINTIENIYEDCRNKKSVLILSGIHAQPLFAAEKAGLIEKIGIENVKGNIEDALNRAKEILGIPIDTMNQDDESSEGK
ncbi:MAG TPA: SulP family inorganic anion transporter [Ignavibacteria bacterium]|nr:SulP family inorganic anion transporter [Ignavibacteria bacterium]HQY51785.1 SulP family inorganic anion transporter [Ignavibacteria bacterium]HRA99352.1 SulP family inorganic anion transporter [Ignavibacteria bacterium]